MLSVHGCHPCGVTHLYPQRPASSTGASWERSFSCLPLGRRVLLHSQDVGSGRRCNEGCSGWRWGTLLPPEWGAAMGGGVSLSGGGVRALLSPSHSHPPFVLAIPCCQQEGGQGVSPGPLQQSSSASVVLHVPAPGTV